MKVKFIEGESELKMHQPEWQTFTESSHFPLRFLKLSQSSICSSVAAKMSLWQSALLDILIKPCSYSKPWHPILSPPTPTPCPVFQSVTLKLRLAVMRRMGWPLTWMAWRRRSAQKTCAWLMLRGPRWTAHSRAPQARLSPRPEVHGCPTGSSSVISVG